MGAFIYEIEVELGDGVGMTLYRVDYFAVYGNGYDSGSVIRTFGAYEKREMAEAVKEAIENGSIHPVQHF